MSGRLVVVVVVVWLVVTAGVFRMGPYLELARVTKGELLEETFGYDVEVARRKLEVLGESGRGLYRTFQVVDSAVAALTGLALGMVLRYAAGKMFGWGSAAGWVAVAPGLLVVAEMVENGLLAMLAGGYPELGEGMVGMASVVTRVKLGLGFGSFPLAAVAMAGLGVRRLRGVR